MPSTARTAETTAFENVRATPFTRIHGRPSRSDYEILKQEAATIASEVEEITYDWSRDATTGDEYGLLGDILGVDDYDHQTGIDTYVEETEPDTYDGTINDTTPTHTRKRKEEEWERIRTCWYIRKGFLKGVTANLRDAIDEQFYSQLKHRHTAYRNTTPFQLLEHLNSTWCPLDVQAKKKLKDAYFTQWDRHEHLTAFGKRLDDDQTTLVRSDITISDEDKLQFYLEQMYESNTFDKAEMMDWEQQPINIKSNYPLAKTHFELKVKAHDTYLQNSSSGATGRNKYESANSMADIGDEIKDYIAKIASSSSTSDNVIANMREADKKKDAEMADMSAQIKQLTAAVAKLASGGQKNTENDDTSTKNRGRRGDRVVEQMTKLRNMGGYCSTHGFHPVGATHDSATCQYKKKDEHNDAATWNNRLGGNTYWPKAIRVAIEQQNHPTWKNKEAPI
jgi:hypothetical protein